MMNNTIETKLNLLVRNYNELKKVKGLWQMGMTQYSCALSFSLKNKTINSKSVEEKIKIIEGNTGLFSVFRGYNLFYMATLLSFESDPEYSFKEILKIYEELKAENLHGNEYLALASIIIYENRNKTDLFTIVSKMKYIYESMKKNHPFLTSSDDYCNIALMAIYSKDLEKDLYYIEEIYEFLSKNGFSKNNDLQAVSQIISFSNDKTMEKCKKIIKLRDILNENDCKMNGYAYPIIGALSLLDGDENTITNEIKNISNKLREVKGFGNWALGKNHRNMISAILVASNYANELENKNDLTNVSDNVFMNIVIAIEIASMVAVTSVAIVASTSS